MLFKNLHENLNINEKSNETPKFYRNTPNFRDSKIYESFDGGLFRGKAAAEFGKLTVYHLLRGLEIESSLESYKKLAQNIPSCSKVFIDEKTAESTMATKVINDQIDYMAIKMQTIFPDYSKNETIKKLVDEFKATGVKIDGLKEISNTIDSNLRSYLIDIKASIAKNNAGLRTNIYDPIDKLNLKEIKQEDFAAIANTYILKPVQTDALVASSNPTERIAGFLEKVLELVQKGGDIPFKFIEYKENGFDFLKDIISTISGEDESKIIPMSSLINSVSRVIINFEINKPEFSRNIFIPSLQSFYVGMLTCLSIVLISNNYYAPKKEGEQGAGTSAGEAEAGISQEQIKKINSFKEIYRELQENAFFENKTIFLKGRDYYGDDIESIRQLKLFFIKLSYIRNYTEADERFLNDNNRFKASLENATKEFQTKVKLPSDGKIGKNTKSAIKAFLDSIEVNFPKS